MRTLQLLLIVFLMSLGINANAQKYTIKQYDVEVQVTKDASLIVKEVIKVQYQIPQHGITRFIPYQYEVGKLPPSDERATMDLTSNGIRKTIIEDISVDNEDYSVSTERDYFVIRIGKKNEMVEGEKTYTIHYTVLNAINFFEDKSELYWNLIGDKVTSTIKKVNFKITLPDSSSKGFQSFVSTGVFGSKENYTNSKWSDNNRIFSGSTTEILGPREGVTIGIVFPKGYLNKPNYFYRNIQWLILPLLVFVIMFFIWYKYGKDDKVTVMTEYYPPKGISPSICGYVIDDTLDKQDLTALIPYWGASGYLKIREIEQSSSWDLGSGKEYEFTKIKELPDDAMDFEKTLFNGIFMYGDVVMLSSLKNVLYTSMNKAKEQLEAEVDRREYYQKNSRGMAAVFALIGLVVAGIGVYKLITQWGFGIWIPVSILASGIITLIFGSLMAKKTEKGNELYRKLAGFKEFIKSVEQDKLKMFLKEDPSYFDKVLPYAIVFNVINNWQDKLKGLDVPPPDWYSGNYSMFTTFVFLTSLNQGLNSMTDSFYSTPKSSAGSGGSWSSGDGGGFSGGGFGGGGVDSW